VNATVTERDAVLRERAAFVRGVNSLFLQEEIPASDAMTAAVERVEAYATEWYPLPKVTRPRVVRDCAAFTTTEEWSVIDGTLRYRHRPDAEWARWGDFRGISTAAPLPERVELWADLFANPTEEVDE
jgi:hypothetical protein